MSDQVTSSELSKQIDVLQGDVFAAKVHFDIFMGLNEEWSKYIDGIRCSPCFWDFTKRAHIDACVLRLCRIYDGHDAALQLTRLLEKSIQKNPNLFSESAFRERLKDEPHRDVDGLAKYQRHLNYEQLNKDIWFCSSKNPLVKNLRAWRDKMIAHFNYDEAVNKSEPFHKRHPLPFEDIRKLIDEAFSIVNSYSSLFRAQTHSTEFASKQHKDYWFVLESMRKRLEMEQAIDESLWHVNKSAEKNPPPALGSL